MSVPAPSAVPPGRVALLLFLLWLAGNALRITILAVPPVMAMVRDDFALNATEVALLSSIPPALFAIAALLGSLLVAKLGLFRALLGGLVLTAVGSALRGSSPTFAVLVVTTVAMSAGVAMLQPIMPAIVRTWVPQRIALGTALYTNGLLVGEVFPTLLTLPLVLPWLGGAWRDSLVFWSMPVALIAVAVAVLAPRGPSPARAPGGPPQKWLPDWHRGLVWRLGAVFCCINALYFSANAFLPIYLAHHGRHDLIGGGLAALNFGQLPASFLLLAWGSRVQRKAWPYVAAGLGSLVALGGLVFDIGDLTAWWAGLLGFCVAGGLILALMLPPSLCKPEDVARTAAGTFTLSYGGGVGVALVGGAAWDLTGMPAMAFLPLAACAAGLVVATYVMKARGELV